MNDGPDNGEQAVQPPPRRKKEPKKVLLRLDPAVHEAIAKWAADDLRSVNAQIEFALRKALDQVGRSPKK